MMKIYHFLSVLVLGLCSAAASATTVWTPTDNNVNYLTLSLDGYNLNGGQLAMFNGGQELFIGALTSGAQVDISGTTASFGGNSIDLGSGMTFTLGVSWNADANGVGTFIGDTGWTQVGTNQYQIFFDDGTHKASSSMIGTDLAPVPVPAAAWLFGTGLIGLVGVARRRRA